MPRSRSTIALPLAASMGLALGAARAEDSNGQVSAAAPPPASASASSPSTTSTPPLRRPRPEPTVVEVIDLGGDRDPQGFAMGAHVGGAFLWNRDSIGQGAGTIALVADFGLGPNSARVPWTLEPFISFAVPYGVLFEQGGHPNRFTEIGAPGLSVPRWRPRGSLGLARRRSGLDQPQSRERLRSPLRRLLAKPNPGRGARARLQPRRLDLPRRAGRHRVRSLRVGRPPRSLGHRCPRADPDLVGAGVRRDRLLLRANRHRAVKRSSRFAETGDPR